MTRIFVRRQGDFPQQSWADCKGNQRSMREKRPFRRCAMLMKTASCAWDKKAAPRSVPWDGCNITAVPPKLHTAFCRMPLDAPITWGRPGGDYSCFPASAQKRQHATTRIPGFQPPALDGKTAHTLFPCIYKKEYSVFLCVLSISFAWIKFFTAVHRFLCPPPEFSGPGGKVRATGGTAPPLPFRCGIPAPGAAGR